MYLDSIITPDSRSKKGIQNSTDSAKQAMSSSTWTSFRNLHNTVSKPNWDSTTAVFSQCFSIEQNAGEWHKTWPSCPPFILRTNEEYFVSSGQSLLSRCKQDDVKKKRSAERREWIYHKDSSSLDTPMERGREAKDNLAPNSGTRTKK